MDRRTGQPRVLPQERGTRQWNEAEEYRLKLEDALAKGLPPFGPEPESALTPVSVSAPAVPPALPVTPRPEEINTVKPEKARVTVEVAVEAYLADARSRELESFKRYHPHMFRDTFAVEMLLAGVPIDQVSLLLGHASVKITEKSYSPFVKARQIQRQESVRNAWLVGQPSVQKYAFHCKRADLLFQCIENGNAELGCRKSPPCTGSVTRDPGSICLESGSVPSHYAFRLDQNQGPFPVKPKPPQNHPKQLVRRRKSRLRSPPFQNSKLLSQRKVFQD